MFPVYTVPDELVPEAGDGWTLPLRRLIVQGKDPLRENLKVVEKGSEVLGSAVKELIAQAGVVFCSEDL
jgi:hypothetical protein